MSNVRQVGATQTAAHNVFLGSEVFALPTLDRSIIASLRIVITGAAGNYPTNWIVRVIQGSSTEEFTGATSGDPSTTLTLSDLLLVSGQTVSVTLENDEPLDTAVTVSASMFAQSIGTTLDSGGPVERAITDLTPITFSFIGPSLTLTGTRSINNDAYAPVTGAISYVRTDGDVDLYTLAYNAADRPTASGTVRYRFVASGWTPGAYERFVSLQVTTLGTNAPVDWINNAAIANNAITSAKIATGAITATQIADNTITAAKIATDAITSAKIATDAITAAKIAANAITDVKIASGAFTSAKFAAGAFDAVWTVTTRTLTAISDSAGITTLLSRITALMETKAQADTRQTTLVSEINQNEVKIDAIKAQTDQFTFTGSNVNANSQVVSDKTGYGLTAGERVSTAAAVRTDLAVELGKINTNLDAQVSTIDDEVLANQQTIIKTIQNATGTQY